MRGENRHRRSHPGHFPVHYELLRDDEEESDPEFLFEFEEELDPAEELDPEEPAGDVVGADVGEPVPLSDVVELVLLSVLDSPLMVSAGFPLFSDLLPGSFIFSE